MEKTVIQYKLDKEDVHALVENLHGAQIRKQKFLRTLIPCKVLIAFYIIIPALITVGVYTMIWSQPVSQTHRPMPTHQLVTDAFAFYGATCVSLTLLFSTMYARRYTKKITPGLREYEIAWENNLGDSTLTVSDVGFFNQYPKMTRGEEWTHLDNISKSPDHLFLRFKTGALLIIPRKSFQSNISFDVFAKNLNEKFASKFEAKSSQVSMGFQSPT